MISGRRDNLVRKYQMIATGNSRQKEIIPDNAWKVMFYIAPN